MQHLQLEPVKPKRVVVVGSSGFIGKHLTNLLEQKNVEVVEVTSKDVDLRHPEAPLALQKLTQPEDSVVYLSALTPDKGKDVATLMKNLTMASHMAQYVSQSRLSHFICISSDAVYDESQSLVRETTPTSPGSLYGYMHQGRELIMKTALDVAKIPAAFLRPCAVYGSGDTHNSYGPNRFLRTALKDKKISLFGGGEEQRDHIFIDDVVNLIWLALSHKSVGNLNLVSGHSLAFFEVATAIKNLLGGVEIERSPRGGPVTHKHFDRTELIKAFPTFKGTPLEKGFQLTLEAFRKDLGHA